MLIDLERFNSLKDGDSEEETKWFLEVIGTLFENMVTRLSNIAQCIQDADHAKLQKELHQVKGIALNFGLNELASATTSAEQLCKDGKFAEAIAASAPVAGIWEKTKSEIEKQIQA